jgi:uncharacterized membrane protein YhaH (DUF805 family)
MNFVESVKTCLKKYVTFSGRASRSEFWWFCLFCFVLRIVANILDMTFFTPAMAQEAVDAVTNSAMDAGAAMQATDMAMAEQQDMMMAAGPAPIFSAIVGLGTFLPSIAVAARRLHDVNKSGWWQLIAITIIGLIPLLIWYVKKGEDGSNRFGDDPLKV